MPTNAEYLTALHKNIDQYFSFNEVRTLCFELGVDYENIAGETKSAFIRNLIVQLSKRNRLQELVDKVKVERTFLPWQDVPSNFELPKSIAEEDIKKVVHYTIYGNQFNVSDNAQVGHIGDNINTGGGEYVAGDKNVHGDEVHGDKVGGDKVQGDKISVGDISGGQGIAIGSGASAQVQTTVDSNETTQPTSPSSELAKKMGTAVQQAVEQAELYVDIATKKNPQLGSLLSDSVRLILSVAQENKPDSAHLQLLLLGQKELARQLADSVPGIEQVVGALETAVTNQ